MVDEDLCFWPAINFGQIMGLRAEIDDQFFSARTLAEALMQLFSVCKWPSKNILQRLQKRCRRVFLRRVNGFL